MTTAMIKAVGLSKTYQSRKRGRVVALDDFHLECARGEAYALIGSNGAGKTTALGILSTLLTPSQGEAWIGGYSVRTDPDRVRRLIGVVSYETGVYEFMTPREIGYFFGRLNGMHDAEIKRNLEHTFDLLNMRPFVDELTRGFSTGMRQKTVVMRAMVTDPPILILDEPTAGLDLLASKSLLDYIQALRGEGRTILFSTHILSEVEDLADRVGIIAQGKLLAEGMPEELKQKAGMQTFRDVFFARVEATA